MNPIPADLAARGIPSAEGGRVLARPEKVEKVARADRAAHATSDRTTEAGPDGAFAAILRERKQDGSSSGAPHEDRAAIESSAPASARASLSRVGPLDDESFAPPVVVPRDALRSMGAYLRAQLEDSGLFYESHQKKWLSGHYPLARLRKEPQNHGVDRVAAQLRFLEHPVFTFRGQVGENEFAWTARREPGGEAGCLLHLRGDAQRSDVTLALSLQTHPEAPGGTLMKLVVTAKHVSSHPFLWRLVEIAERIRAVTGHHVGVEIIDAAQI